MLSLLLHSPIASLLLGPIVKLIVDGLKRAFDLLDASPAWIKQLVAVGIACLFVMLTHFLPGIVAPAECANTLANGLSSACEQALMSTDFITAILTTLVAIALKHGSQNAKA